MLKIRVLPADDSANGWGRFLPQRQPAPPLRGAVSADWAVVGAGFAGLAAARRLAENNPHDKIVLLDAQAVGEGASGRNSGFAIDLPIGHGTSPAALESSRRRVRLARAAIHYLESCVRSGSIECQWRRNGRYHAAASPRGKEVILDPYARELDGLGEPYRWLDHDQMLDATGSPYYHAAVYTPGGALMNPVALTRGLADTLPAGVALFENSPVIAAKMEGDVHLTTPEGSVSAARMILANNGFAQQFGFFRGRLMIFALHASLSRRLTAAEQGRLGKVEDWGLTTSGSAAGVTVRYTVDRRILIRQRFEYRPDFRCSDASRASARRLHQMSFVQRFPMLPDVDMEHTWTGFVCVSRNLAPGFGQVASNVYAAVCQNSLGVSMGTISGILVADLVQGRDNPLLADMDSLGRPAALPPRPVLDIGVRARFAWETWSAGSNL